MTQPSPFELFDKKRWNSFLKKFSDVLRIPVFMVDRHGAVLVSPFQDGGSPSRYGAGFLHKTFHFNFTGRSREKEFLEEFQPHGEYFEIKDPLDLRVFAVPVRGEKGHILAYILVGPVILNRRWESADYINMAGQIGLDTESLIDDLQEVRPISFVAMKGILDLLNELAKDIVQLNLERRRLKKYAALQDEGETIPQRIVRAADDLYATIHLDELLVTVLDVALNLTRADQGSIMLLDPETNMLVLRVSRGIPDAVAERVRVKVGQGIAGTAVQDKKTFLIEGTRGDNRIAPYLKRPEIQRSAVVPLYDDDKVLGVLNLNVTREAHSFQAPEDQLQHLARLISAAVRSL